jgi:tetratricopeptide (TPR) repeat protein
MRSKLSPFFGVLFTAGLLASTVAVAEIPVYHGQTSYVHQYRAADQLLQTGKYQQAEERFTRMLQANPNNIQARAGLALAQAELFKLDSAEKNAKIALQRDSKNVRARMALGAIYRNRTASLDMTYKTRRDDYLNASVAEFNKALQIDANNPEIYTQLGTTLRFQGRLDEADQAFAKALALDSDYGEALLGQGFVKLERGDSAAAKSFFEKAIAKNSKNHMAHFRLGEAYLKEGDLHLALKTFNTALALDPNNASILSRMGEAYDKQGNQAAAVSHFRRAIQQNPSFMPAYIGLSNLWDTRGDGELAMAELKSALNVNPNYAPARNQLGRLALSVDKPSQAIDHYKQALRVNPNDPEALKGLSQALTVMAQRSAQQADATGVESDYVEAEEAIQEALRLNPNDLRLHLANLRISQLAGKPDMSASQLEQIINMQPRNASEEMLQGEALLTVGRYEEADRLFQKLIRESQGNSDRLLLIGDTLKANGDLVRSKEAYQSALTAEPGSLKATRGIQRLEKAEADSEKTLRLAQSLNNRRQRHSALDYYEEALLKNPRQPEARLALSKLYERRKQYNQAAFSYQHYVGLQNDTLTPKEREKFQKKIRRMQELAARQEAKQQVSKR